jgi:hypothetical protein
MPAASRRAPRLAGALAALALAGCAPRIVQVPELVPATRMARYDAALRQREAKGTAVDARVLLWAEVPAGERLPGAEGRLLLAGPDAFRLRVASLIGTAIDLGARGESLAAYVPSRRRGMTIDAPRDSLGVDRPGSLVFRAVTGAWRPPERAWEEATWRDSLLDLRWPEGDDTLALAVGSHGLPVRASLARADGATISVDYGGWDRTQGLAWPQRFTVSDDARRFRLACRVTRLRFLARADSLRIAVPIPRGTVRLTPSELRRMLERMGAM